jgi:hypothetical protein
MLLLCGTDVNSAATKIVNPQHPFTVMAMNTNENPELDAALGIVTADSVRYSYSSLHVSH